MAMDIQESKDTNTIFEKFMDYCPINCLLVNDGSIIIYANKSFLNTFHLSKKCLGMNVLDVLPIDFAKSCLRCNELLLELNLPINTLERCLLNDNKEHVFSLCKFPIKFDDTFMIGCWVMEK